MTDTVVLDASAAVDYLMGLVAADAVLEHHVVVPDIYVTEVGNAFAEASKRGVLTPDEARQRLDAALMIPTEVIPAARLVDQAWPAATAHLSFPDAVYVAAAAALSCELWTTDERLVRSSQIPRQMVRLLD